MTQETNYNNSCAPPSQNQPKNVMEQSTGNPQNMPNRINLQNVQAGQPFPTHVEQPITVIDGDCLVEDQTDRRTHYCQPVKMQPAQSYVERPATQWIYDTSRSVQRETERTSQPRPKLEGNSSQQIEDWRQAPMVSANGSFNSNQRPAPSRRSSLTASSKGRRSYPDRQFYTDASPRTATVLQSIHC